LIIIIKYTHHTHTQFVGVIEIKTIQYSFRHAIIWILLVYIYIIISLRRRRLRIKSVKRSNRRYMHLYAYTKEQVWIVRLDEHEIKSQIPIKLYHYFAIYLSSACVACISVEKYKRNAFRRFRCEKLLYIAKKKKKKKNNNNTKSASEIERNNKNNQ